MKWIVKLINKLGFYHPAQMIIDTSSTYEIIDDFMEQTIQLDILQREKDKLYKNLEERIKKALFIRIRKESK